MKIIAIPGGGGKTTMAKKYPDKFIDIDEFIWSDQNKEYHDKIINAIDLKDFTLLGTIYKEIYLKSYEYLKNLDKILLVHHPDNAIWLNSECLMKLKPSMDLFINNIKNRSKNLKDVSCNSWNNLEVAKIYYSHEELEKILLNL